MLLVLRRTFNDAVTFCAFEMIPELKAAEKRRRKRRACERKESSYKQKLARIYKERRIAYTRELVKQFLLCRGIVVLVLFCAVIFGNLSKNNKKVKQSRNRTGVAQRVPGS
jgi:hypothetical protein